MQILSTLKPTHLHKHPQLSHRPSNLNSLNTTNLTSFPLAPPAPHPLSRPNSPEINALTLTSSRPNSFYELDPIVLVEDYIKPPAATKRMLSVRDLKKSVAQFDFVEGTGVMGMDYVGRCRNILKEEVVISQATRHISGSSAETKVDKGQYLLTANFVDCESFETGTGFVAGQDSLTHEEEVFTLSSCRTAVFFGETLSQATMEFADVNHTIPEFSLDTSLKYCIICETALYDLSAQLTGSSDHFEEFVCSGCTEKYELLSQLAENYDMTMTGCVPLQADAEDIETALRKDSEIHMRFSGGLVRGLQRHLIMDKADAVEWLAQAKRKLRWRWRVNGLLPKFLS